MVGCSRNKITFQDPTPLTLPGSDTRSHFSNIVQLCLSSFSNSQKVGDRHAIIITRQMTLVHEADALKIAKELCLLLTD